MTDLVKQRVGNRALNATAKAMCQAHPRLWGMSPEQRRVMVPTFVRRTPDAALLDIRNLGHASLARLRAEWPYDPAPVTRCACCDQPLPPRGDDARAVIVIR